MSRTPRTSRTSRTSRTPAHEGRERAVLETPRRTGPDATNATNDTTAAAASANGLETSLLLAETMQRFFGAYKSWIRSHLPPGETNPARLMVLVFLRKMGPLPMGALSARLALPKSNITLLVDELESEGLVVRGQHPEDRRATLLELTAEGQRFTRSAGDAYDRHVAALFDVLSPAARKTLLATFETLIEHVGQTVGESRPAR